MSGIIQPNNFHDYYDYWDRPQKIKCPVCGSWVMVLPEELLIPTENLCEECFKYDEECRRVEEERQDRFYDWDY